MPSVQVFLVVRFSSLNCINFSKHILIYAVLKLWMDSVQNLIVIDIALPSRCLGQIINVFDPLSKYKMICFQGIVNAPSKKYSQCSTAPYKGLHSTTILYKFFYFLYTIWWSRWLQGDWLL